MIMIKPLGGAEERPYLHAGLLVVNPGERRLEVDRIVALP